MDPKTLPAKKELIQAIALLIALLIVGVLLVIAEISILGAFLSLLAFIALREWTRSKEKGISFFTGEKIT